MAGEKSNIELTIVLASQFAKKGEEVLVAESGSLVSPVHAPDRLRTNKPISRILLEISLDLLFSSGLVVHRTLALMATSTLMVGSNGYMTRGGSVPPREGKDQSDPWGRRYSRGLVHPRIEKLPILFCIGYKGFEAINRAPSRPQEVQPNNKKV